MSFSERLYEHIVQDLVVAGESSPYTADANEPDPRYLSYGVRSPEKKQVWRENRTAVRDLAESEQIRLATRLIRSRYGEQQELGLWILEPLVPYYTPDKFAELDQLIRCIHGWSKVDAFAGSLVREVLWQHPDAFLELVRTWNRDPDQWLRRMSVVLFTRKVAQSGQFTDVALEMCHNLRHAPEDLVRKGVGWALKDLMRADKPRLLDYVRELRRENVSRVITSYAIRDLKGDERADFLASV